MVFYVEVLWIDYEYGQDEVVYYLLGEVCNYLVEDSFCYCCFIVIYVYCEVIEFYDCYLYEKGVCVYYMIWVVLGDELFFRVVYIFVNDYVYGIVEIVDLLWVIEKVMGFNLFWLFDQYVFWGGYFEFKVSYSWDNDNKLVKLMVI